MAESNGFESFFVIGFFIVIVVVGLCFCCLCFSWFWAPVVRSAVTLFNYATRACCGACTGLVRRKPRPAVAPGAVADTSDAKGDLAADDANDAAVVSQTPRAARQHRPLETRGDTGPLAGCVELLTCFRCCGLLPRPVPLRSYRAPGAQRSDKDDLTAPTTALLGYQAGLPLLAL